MKTYGYCRISTAEQNENRQLDMMTELNIPESRIFVDKKSGKDFARPAWQELMKILHPGDLVYIASLCRMGRNYEEITSQWRYLTKERGVHLSIIDMPLLNTTNGGDLMGVFLTDIVLQVLSFVSENERITLRQRQAQGIAAARARGVHLGRSPIRLPENFSEIVKSWERGNLSFEQALEQTGLKRSTFYSRLKELRAGKKK